MAIFYLDTSVVVKRYKVESETQVIDYLPEETTLEDLQYHLYVLQKVRRGLNDAREGRVFTQAEMERRFAHPNDLMKRLKMGLKEEETGELHDWDDFKMIINENVMER